MDQKSIKKLKPQGKQLKKFLVHQKYLLNFYHQIFLKKQLINRDRMTSGLDYNVDQMSEMFLKLSCQTRYKWNSSGIICKFSQRTYPKISYSDYLKRLLQHSDCSLQCFVIVLIYLDRFTTYNPDLWLDDASIYTITLVMLVIAVKFLDDHKHSNKYFANLGGISLRLLNEMELELLQLMEFKLFIKEDELFRYMKYFL